MERLVLHQDPKAFLARARDFLLADEAANNLLFGIAHGVEQGRYPDFVLATLERDDEVVAAAVQTDPFPMVLALAGEDEARALARLVEAPLPGVNGPVAQARAFAEEWSARTGATAQRLLDERIYVLRTVRPPAGVPGRARVAEPDDVAVIAGWFAAFEAEALPEGMPRSPDPGRDVARRIAERSLLLWEDDGEPVCVAGAQGPTPNGIRIGPVYTPPARRGRGYAAACTAEVSHRQIASGRRFCFLYTDLANPTSNGVYRRIGYEPVCDVAVYRFDDQVAELPRSVGAGRATGATPLDAAMPQLRAQYRRHLQRKYDA